MNAVQTDRKLDTGDTNAISSAGLSQPTDNNSNNNNNNNNNNNKE